MVNNKNYKKRNYKKRRAPKKALSGRQATAVKKLVAGALDEAIEDKYRLDTLYGEHNTDFDAATKTILYNVSPRIPNGTEVNDRTGNKVKLKYFRSFIRLLPARFHSQHVIDGTPIYAANWVPSVPDYKCYLLKVNNELMANLSSAEARAALVSKFRQAGTCWQDYAQDAGQKAVTSIKLLEKWTMTPKWRQIVSSFAPIDANGTLAASSFSLTPDYQANGVVTAVPQYSYYELYCNKVSQKIEINDTDNSPMKYQYWIFIQCTNGYNETTYNPVVQPDSFESRHLWVFEDA